MMNNKRGKIIIIVAPSGAGKSTLISRLKEDFPELKESISNTTRAKRKGEVDGKSYFFISKEEFEKKIKEEEFIEWATVHSNYYGTSKKFVKEGLAQGDILLFDLDVQGARAMRSEFGDEAAIIFVEPPSLEELEKRLRQRGTDKEEIIKERIENARKELLLKDSFDFLILNDDLERSYQELFNIVRSIINGKK